MQKNHSLSPLLHDWYNRGGFKQINGHEIFVIEEGRQELPVLILIHGFPTSSWDFCRIWPYLKDKYRLITLDMLGFGFSDKPDNKHYKIHNQADLFIELLGTLDINEFSILAHDYGVSVAQEILARHYEGSLPSKALSCCFLNGGLFPETHRALMIQKVLLSSWGKYANHLLGFHAFKHSFSKTFGPKTQPTSEDLKLFWEAINFNNGRHVFHNLITYMNDRREFRERWVSALQKSTLPVSLINGSVDPVSGAHLVNRYKELNCRLDYLKEFSTLGHYPHHEAPEKIADAYQSFIEQTVTLD